MANRSQKFPYLLMNIIQDDYNIKLKVYISHFRMAIQIYTKPKGPWPTTKRVVLYMPFQISTKSVPKRGFDSVGDFDFNNPESNSWQTQNL